MFSPLNNVNSNMYEITCDDPPPYNDISPSPIWTISLAPSNNQAGDNHALPPAYHTLSNVPLVNVPLPTSQSNSPPTTEQWHMTIPRSIYSNPSPTQATAFYSQQLNIETREPNHSNNSTPSRRTGDDHSWNLRIIATTQRATSSVLEKRFRKRKILVIGSSIILAAIVQLIVCLPLMTYSASKLMSYGTPYWASTIYIITGFLLLATKRKPSSCLVWISVVSNIMTWISCCTALALAIIDLGEFNEEYSGVSTYYYILIAANALVLLLSLPAGLIGISALNSQ